MAAVNRYFSQKIKTVSKIAAKSKQCTNMDVKANLTPQDKYVENP